MPSARTVKSGVSLRYTLLLTAADAKRYVTKTLGDMG